MPITVFDIKGVPAQRRERIEAAVLAGGKHVSGPHEAFIAADPFRGGVRVLITGPHGLERTLTFALDEDRALIAERVRETLDCDLISGMLRNPELIKDSKEERIARLSLKQGIIVAVITALSGLGGAIVQKASSSTAKQDWLYIYGVDVPSSDELRVRVVAVVNGHAYSYPSRAVWMSGGEMTEEKFALPVGSTSYDISFSVLSLVGGYVFTHQSEEVVHASPTSGRAKYKAYKMSADGSHWGRAIDSVEIKYEIRPY